MIWNRATPLDEAKWIVIDCETSGLDPKRDRLLSVAAVEVIGERIPANAAYAAVLRQEEPSAAENILVHGIGREAQLGGRPAVQVLPEVAALLQGGLPAAFHAPLDRGFLHRAFAEAGIRTPRRNWLDLAVLAPLFFPSRTTKDLDGWLSRFSIECPARHDALSDAYATAQLLLVILNEARRQRIATAEALIRTASSARWLPA